MPSNSWDGQFVPTSMVAFQFLALTKMYKQTEARVCICTHQNGGKSILGMDLSSGWYGDDTDKQMKTVQLRGFMRTPSHCLITHTQSTECGSSGHSTLLVTFGRHAHNFERQTETQAKHQQTKKKKIRRSAWCSVITVTLQTALNARLKTTMHTSTAIFHGKNSFSCLQHLCL